MSRFEQFKREAFAGVIRKAGRLTTKAHAQERLKVCASCEYAGKVEPWPGLVMEGCEGCGCPFATKPFMVTFGLKRVTCPHPEGNKWEEVDNQFLNQK